MIDKATMPSVTKFAYLKSYLDFKVRKCVEGLPLSSEGYNRAKSILQDKYGKDLEVIKAYTRQIFELPTISNANTQRIHEFRVKLTFCVQSLQTLGKLEQVNGYVSMTPDKLPAIKGDLVRMDPSWENWTFEKLSEALRLWTRRNPKERQLSSKADRNHQDDRKTDKHSSKLFKTQQKNVSRTQTCVYCDAIEHKSSTCPNVTSVPERKSIKRLCFNCTGPHKVIECLGKTSCQICRKKHHTSICNTEQKPEGMLTAVQSEDSAKVVYPVVLLEVDGIKTRALLDTGAGSCYASAKLVNDLRKRPAEIKTKKIEMMFGSMTNKAELYDVNVKSISGDLSLNISVSKIDKPELMVLPNPNYEELKTKYKHLEGVRMDDNDAKPLLPVHLVLGASE